MSAACYRSRRNGSNRFRASLGIQTGIALGLLAAAAQAQSLDVASGVGGGGYSLGGTFHPESAQQNPNAPNIMVIGGDVCGIYRTTNLGQTWVEWNQGLENADEGASYYVEDIVGVATGTVNFTAATRGGL